MAHYDRDGRSSRSPSGGVVHATLCTDGACHRMGRGDGSTIVFSHPYGRIYGGRDGRPGVAVWAGRYVAAQAAEANQADGSIYPVGCYDLVGLPFPGAWIGAERMKLTTI